jgi:hypothetical protein
VPGERQLVALEDARVEAGLDLAGAAARVGRVHQAAALGDDRAYGAPGTGEALALGGRGDVADLCGDGVGHAHGVAEDVGGAKRPREAEQHAVGAADAHLGAQQPVLGLLGGEVAVGQALVEEGAKRLCAPDRRFDQPLARAHQLADGDGVGPGHELRAAFELAEMGDQSHEDLLRGVLGLLGVAEEAQRQPVDRVLHLLDQPRQRRRAARGGGLHEIL